LTPLKTKPIRTVLVWQLIATAVIAAIADSGSAGTARFRRCWGTDQRRGGAAYALLRESERRAADAGTSLVAMFRAEAGKILLILAGLWLVLSHYEDVVAVAFFGAFVVTVVVFSMAILVRD
jgi:ATP synthase protein I